MYIRHVASPSSSNMESFAASVIVDLGHLGMQFKKAVASTTSNPLRQLLFSKTVISYAVFKIVNLRQFVH